MRDLHERWPHRWLTPKAEPGNSSIHRYGIFAKEDIKKGEPINAFGGIAVPKSEIKEYRKIVSHAGVQVSDDFFIVPSSNEEITERGIFNHSCEPNIGFNSSVTMVSIKDIKQGEELVMNYAFMETDFDQFDCKCKSSDCRKVVDSNSWKDSGFQNKYLKYYSPYLRNKVEQ
ncbi:SET domain-containing protein-lysine N-methyltransferase [Candidatus Woesearchaeota archaeon]|nr:SET domain-containing protein-lysine N-methyltransferase [Candidatus Woesearchaeota archaeon]